MIQFLHAQAKMTKMFLFNVSLWNLNFTDDQQKKNTAIESAAFTSAVSWV